MAFNQKMALGTSEKLNGIINTIVHSALPQRCCIIAIVAVGSLVYRFMLSSPLPDVRYNENVMRNVPEDMPVPFFVSS